MSPLSLESFGFRPTEDPLVWANAFPCSTCESKGWECLSEPRLIRVEKDRPNEVKVAACAACKRRRTACSTGSRSQRVRIVNGTPRLVLVASDEEANPAASQPAPQKTQTDAHRPKRKPTPQIRPPASRKNRRETTDESQEDHHEQEDDGGTGDEQGEGDEEDGEEVDQAEQSGDSSDVDQEGGEGSEEDEADRGEGSADEEGSAVHGGGRARSRQAEPPVRRKQQADSRSNVATGSKQPSVAQPAVIAATRKRQAVAQASGSRVGGREKAPRITHRPDPSATVSFEDEPVATTSVHHDAASTMIADRHPSRGTSVVQGWANAPTSFNSRDASRAADNPLPGRPSPITAEPQSSRVDAGLADDSAADQEFDDSFFFDLFPSLNQAPFSELDATGQIPGGVVGVSASQPAELAASAPLMPAEATALPTATTAPTGPVTDAVQTPVRPTSNAASSLFAGHSVWRDHRRQPRRSSLDSGTIRNVRAEPAAAVTREDGLADAVHAMITDHLRRDSADHDAKVQGMQQKITSLERQLSSANGEKSRLEQASIDLSIKLQATEEALRTSTALANSAVEEARLLRLEVEEVKDKARKQSEVQAVLRTGLQEQIDHWKSMLEKSA